MDNLKRNINIDAIKCVAVFFVVSVHFFLNNGFYSTSITCPRMFVMCFMRTVFMTCVPLFMLISGYLLYKKELSLKFYKGTKKIIFPYLIITLLTAILRIILYGKGFFDDTTIMKTSWFISGFFEFSTIVKYGWYVEMYLGLYLLVPFLNKMLSDKKQDIILILTLVLLTCLWTFCQKHLVIIDWWQKLWPLTYYFIGACIKKYNFKINKKLNAILLLLAFVVFSLINIIISYQKPFIVNNSSMWASYQNITTSVLLFLLFINSNFECLKNSLGGGVSCIAKLSLGIYLSSFMFDTIFYHYLNMYIGDVTQKLEWYFVIVPLVFICSFIVAYLADLIIKFLNKVFNFLLKKLKN